MESKFAALELQNSITYDADNAQAVDIGSPLPFIAWVEYFANVSTDPTFLLLQYKNYINDWFDVQKTSQASKSDVIQGLYVSLFKNIAFNYLNAEEKRFVQNANLGSASDIAAIMPLFVRKIRDVCIHFAAQREKVKYAVIDHNLKSSPYSIEKVVRETLDQSFLDPTVNKAFTDAGISVSSIKNQLTIEFEPLYDTETNYFDINPLLPASAYDATGDRAEYFNANSYTFDPNLFVDFDASVVAAIQAYPVILQGLGSNFAVDLNFTSEDLQFLKDQDYTSLVSDLDTDNLKLQHLKESLQTFSGTTFYYLSTNSDRAFVYGKLFDADVFSNYLNRRYPTAVTIESNKIEPENVIGRFYKTDKLGILNYVSFNLTGRLNSISPNSIYVFPDPSIYGNISGLSRTQHNSPFVFSEDVSSLKNNNTVTYAFGRALTDYLVKFKGYQSRGESLNYDPEGVSRFQDPQDFFKGLDRNVWTNEDIFPPLPYNQLPIKQRSQTLLNTLFNKTLVQHKTDIYNNEFALYKEIYATPNPASIRSQELGSVVTCLTLDGYTFWDAASGYNFNYSLANSALNHSGVTANTNGLTSLSAYDYYLQAILLYPEMDFYKTVTTFDVQVYDGLNLGDPPAAATVLIWDSQTLNYDGLDPLRRYTYIRSASTLDGGPLLYNGLDQLYVDYDRSLTEKNVLLGGTLPTAATVIDTTRGNLSADITLYNQHEVYGDLYFRSYNSSYIGPASAVLSAVFTKYPAAVSTQAFTQLKSFDLVADTAIFETPNYLIFEKLEYDFNTNSFPVNPTIQNYIYIPSVKLPYTEEYNQFTNTWYIEKDGVILVGAVSITSASSALNLRTWNISLYEYDFSELNYLGVIQTFDLDSTVLQGRINLVNIERPLLSYDDSVGSYVIKFLAKDPTELFLEITLFFKLDNNYKPYNVQLYTHYPQMSINSLNAAQNNFTLLNAGIKDLGPTAGTFANDPAGLYIGIM